MTRERVDRMRAGGLARCLAFERALLFVVCFLWLLPESSLAQSFPDLPAENLDTSDNAIAGTFSTSRFDFVVCKGQRFSEETPPGRPEDRIEGLSAGDYNNAVVAQVLRDIDSTDAGSAARRRALDASLEKFRRGLKADPQFFPFLYNAGRILLLQNLPEQGLHYLALARARLPEFSLIYLHIGRAHARLGDGISAAENFRTAYKKNPFSPSALLSLSEYYLDTGAYPQAADAYQRVLKQFPQNATALIGLGRLHMRKNEPLRARQYFEAVETDTVDGQERNDYDRSLHFYLAEVLTALKDYREAVRHYDRLLGHPEDPFFLEQSLVLLKKRRDATARLAEIVR